RAAVRRATRHLERDGPRRGVPGGPRQRRLPAAVGRQPRHHDRGRRPGRRAARAQEGHHMTANSPNTTAQKTGAHDAPQKIRITDSTLRDGSHAMAHRFTEEQVRGVVHALDAAGVEVIEVTHGDGLGGSSFNYGFSLEDDVKLVAAAVDEATRAKIAVLM